MKRHPQHVEALVAIVIEGLAISQSLPGVLIGKPQRVVRPGNKLAVSLAMEGADGRETYRILVEEVDG